MKTLLCASLLMVALVSSVAAQPTSQRVTEPQPVDGVYRVSERGAHQRTWQKLSSVTLPNGRTQVRTNSYVELATGMHAWSQAEQKWIDADDQIELAAGGAISRKAAHQVGFSANVNNLQGTIELFTPDGKSLKSRVVGLAFTESDTGKSVFIAEVKNAPGFVVGKNQVIYVDAFDQVNADIRYTTTRASFEADVILREKLPSPADYGLKPATTRLEVWTEFLNPPEPVKEDKFRKRANGQADADVTLNFGAMRIGPGKAFSLPDALQPADPLQRTRDEIPVTKEWRVIQGKTYLIETVPYAEAKPQVDKLPQPRLKAQVGREQQERMLASVTTVRRVPVSLTQTTPALSDKIYQIAKVDTLPHQPGYVLDWVGVGSDTDFTFKGDMTYHVTGVCQMDGTTIIEGGTVIKYDRDDYPSNRIWLTTWGPTICRTSSYRPAIFTAKDDDTIGESPLPGSNGTPTGSYPCWAFNTQVDGVVLEYIHVRYANSAIAPYQGNSVVKNCQMIDCQIGVIATGGTCSVRNCLIVRPTFTAFSGESNVVLLAEHVTVRDANQMIYVFGGGSLSLLLTNSIIAGLTNVTSDFTNSFGVTLTNTTSSGSVFQTMGAGRHYLADNTYRNQGTTAINASLWADLKKKTTYPPLLITNNITSFTTLSPVVQRDSDAPDLGYHYDPLDYLLSGIVVTNATLLFTNSVAIGTYGTYGIHLSKGSQIVSEGTAIEPNRLGHVQRVQEQPTFVSGSTNYTWLRINDYANTQTGIRLAHTDVSMLSGSGQNRLLLDYMGWLAPATVEITDSYLRGTYTDFFTPNSGLEIIMRNNLSERSVWTYTQDGDPHPAFTLTQHNNLFHGGEIRYHYLVTNSVWIVADNLFYSDLLYRDGSNFNASYNGYKSGLSAFANDSSTKTNLVADYQSGPMTTHLGYLGNFYYPTSGTNLASLVNAGSRSAADAGLFHHTTRVDQTKDASTVDIGFHYVALNGSNLPNDYDGDGIPDYLEDRNGNGTHDSGSETNWESSNSLVSGNAGLQVFTLLK